MHDFRGKTVLVTGALGSLGRVQSQAFAAAGASVILVDRPENEAAGAAFASDLRGRYVGQDLNDLAGSEARFSGEDVDVLVNNAARIINRPFEHFSLTEYEDQIRVNSSAAV